MNNKIDNQQLPQDSVQRPYPYYVPPQDDEINLLELWKVLAQQKTLIFIITMTITLLALVYSLVVTPIYRAEALLAPVSKEKVGRLGALAGQFGGLASLADINLSGEAGDVEEAIATLKSRMFTNKFIEEENILPVLFEDNWDKEDKKWINNKNIPTLWDAYELFHKSIRFINVDNKNGLITLAVEFKDPVLAANWANKLVQRINEKLRHEAIMDSEKSIKYLEAELQKTSILEVKESIYSLIEAQTKTKMLASTQDEYAFRVIDKALAPQKKIRPKRTLIVVSSFILGVMFAVFVAFFRRFIAKQAEE